MKGLVIKDLYITQKSYKVFLVLSSLCWIPTLVTKEVNAFSFLYPMGMFGMVPIGLIVSDEAEKWNEYAQLFPCKKSALISSKYVLLLILSGINALLCAVMQILNLVVFKTISLQSFFSLILVSFSLTTLLPALTLPFVYRFGSTKGRLFGTLCIGVVFSCAIILSQNDTIAMKNIPFLSAVLFLIICVVILGLSYQISISVYLKRQSK